MRDAVLFFATTSDSARFAFDGALDRLARRLVVVLLNLLVVVRLPVNEHADAA